MEKSTAVALITGLFALVAGGFSGTQLESLQSPQYIQCRNGMAFGQYIAQDVKYLYQCDLTKQYELCWKTTTTRCYPLNVTLLTGLIESKDNEVTISESNTPLVHIIQVKTTKTFNVSCLGPSCTDKEIVRGDLLSKGLI